MSLYGVINQAVYPLTRDVDDCAVIGTFWASRAAGYRGSLPTVPEFRLAAGNPDDPGVADGLTNAQVWAGVRGTALRHLSPVRWDANGQGSDWAGLMALIRLGYVASLAVLSSKLPANLRFGFDGWHRVGIAWDDGRLYLANPLAPQGSAPLPIGEGALQAAAMPFGGSPEAVLFPTLTEVPDVLPVTDPTPKTVDIPVGKQLFDLAGIPKVKVSVKQNDVYSPFRSNEHRAVVVVTGGVAQLLLVRAIDVDDARPLPTDKKHTVALAIDGKVDATTQRSV